MNEVALIGHALTALLFAVLSVLLLTSWRGRLQGALLLISTSTTAVWAVLVALQAAYRSIPVDVIWTVEVVRNLVWLNFVVRLLEPFTEGSRVYVAMLRYIRFGALLLGVVLMGSLIDIDWPAVSLGEPRSTAEFRLIGQLLFAVLGMALVEQLFRNTPEEHRWGIKHLCIGLGTMFVYDFYLYTDALLFQRLDDSIWSARGMVNAMIVPLIGISAARNPKWSVPVFVSRRMVFHTTTLFSAGIYMLLMALAGYYIRIYGGEWGTVLQIAFLFGAVVVLVVLLFSGHLRARLKVFLNKHFFSYRYDYRDEWLRLIGLLAGQATEMPLRERVILALAEIVESQGGLLWLCSDDDKSCACVARFNHPDVQLPTVPIEESALIRFLQVRHWIVRLDEYRLYPERYEGLELPAWLEQTKDPWLILPLLLEQRVLGFVVLMRPRAPQNLNWENLDLLKTAGMQAASYLALDQAAEALAEARQFEGFNRLSAFVMHDLKNLVAQLSLVAKNAGKHKHNPVFIDDAVKTIENAVSKMNRLMTQLKSAGSTGDARPIDLVPLVRSLVETRAGSRPQPLLDLQVKKLPVLAEPDRLISVIGHIIQNAQDATPASGEVVVRLSSRDHQAVVEISDNGSGMAPEFVETRLFKPFDSTKGLTGMGIGAYECREVVRSLGGQVAVESELGQGTRFSIAIPLAASV